LMRDGVHLVEGDVFDLVEGVRDAAVLAVVELAAADAVHSRPGILKPEHQTILTLRVVEEQSYDAIAHTLGVPIGTVMSRLSRARAELKARLAARTGEKT